MNAKKILIITFFVGIVLTILEYLNAPECVAIHFSHGGKPDSWASREFSFALNLAVHMLVTGTFLSVPVILRKTPVGCINFPNKRHWLASERKESTIEAAAPYFYWFGTATNFFFIAIGFLANEANAREGVRFDERRFLMLLAIFLLFTAGWLIKLHRQFKKPA